MRIAAIYDIHGNLSAVKAVVADIQREEFDLIIVGGDIVPGPQPGETLELLLKLGLPTLFLRGNGDRAVSETKRGIKTEAVPERFLPLLTWCAEQLTAEQCAFLGSLPTTVQITLPDAGRFVFCHATPRNDSEIFTVQTAESHLLPVFEGAGACTVVCGHTHMQFDRMIGSTRVVNAGSVGAPYGKPGAYWLQVGPDISLRCTSYDFQGASEIILRTDYPARDTAAASILSPATEAEMLAVFSPAELS